MTVFLDDLTGKAYKKVKRAMKDTRKILIGDVGDTEFSQDDPGTISFTNQEPTLGMWRTGTFDYNREGIVTTYQETWLYSWLDDSLSDVYYRVDVVGKKGFKTHIKAVDKYQEELFSLVNYSFEPNESKLTALWFDSLPGANQFNETSTGVIIGNSTTQFA